MSFLLLNCEILLRPRSKRDREYPSRPLVGVGALIVDSGRIVLVRRGSFPSRGEWSIPGGLVKVGETLKEAVAREAFEETGLRVEPQDLVELLERIFHDREGRIQYHYVLADYRCRVAGGELAAASDATDAAWIDREQLPQLGLAEVTLRVVLKALDSA
ncbi:MAG: NUDIX hydrolase [Deltaproteobacteria bacterium]